MKRFPQLVLVDTDIGDDIDDALALALALCSPEVEVVGVSTVFGDTQRRAQLANLLLQVYGKTTTPVAAGCAVPLQVRHPPSGVPQAEVLREYQPTRSLRDESGPDLLIRLAFAHPGRLAILCFGPLTNIAVAFSKEPRLAASVQHIFLMGGASQLFLPDWNVRSDARAAQMVFDAGVPITMVGWNVTWLCHLHTKDVEMLFRATNRRLHLLSRLIAIWRQHRPWWRSSQPYLHDPLVVAALCAPQFFRFEHIHARVLMQGPLAGFTIPRLLGGPTLQAATSIECEQARAWMMQRWLSRDVSGRRDG